MSKIVVYGISNCDTIKKTKDWLATHKISFDFHDYKISGISKAKLTDWCTKAGYETILNKKSTTWRSLNAGEQQGITNQSSAVLLMLKNTSIIKRPVTEYDGKLIVGFNEEEYKKAFI